MFRTQGIHLTVVFLHKQETQVGSLLRNYMENDHQNMNQDVAKGWIILLYQMVL